MEPSCIPDRAGNGPYRASPVPWVPTIMDRLDAASASWKLYTALPSMASQGFPIGGYGWAICPTFADCLYTGQAANDVPLFDVLQDASAGALPNFVIVTPTSKLLTERDRCHGDNYIGQNMSALMDGPERTRPLSSSPTTTTAASTTTCHLRMGRPRPGCRSSSSALGKAGYTDRLIRVSVEHHAFVEHMFAFGCGLRAMPPATTSVSPPTLHSHHSEPADDTKPVPRAELRAIRRDPPPADATEGQASNSVRPSRPGQSAGDVLGGRERLRKAAMRVSPAPASRRWCCAVPRVAGEAVVLAERRRAARVESSTYCQDGERSDAQVGCQARASRSGPRHLLEQDLVRGAWRRRDVPAVEQRRRRRSHAGRVQQGRARSTS